MEVDVSLGGTDIGCAIATASALFLQTKSCMLSISLTETLETGAQEQDLTVLTHGQHERL